MTDHFAEKAHDYDARPVPQQISEGVFEAIRARVELRPDQTVLDFGAGTGLICGRLAPLVGHVHAVDISPAMLERLAQKPELHGKVDIHCRDLLEAPLGVKVDLVVSAMAMHHVEDTRAMLATLHGHLVEGGRVAIADLDQEDGDFHPADVEGVHHAGFDRAALRATLEEVGFREVAVEDATVVERDGKRYPIFLATATR